MAVEADFIGADRNIRAETPLGADVVLPKRMTITEGINALFKIEFDVLAKENIQADQLIGKACDVSVRKDVNNPGDRRTWNGVCYQLIEDAPVSRGYRAYTIVLGPEVEKLKYRVNSKAWQNKSSLDVLEELFAEHGLKAPTIRVNNRPAKQIFSQQNESDFDYLLRLLQVDGLFFYFVHSGGAKGSVAAKHTMIVCDDATGYSDGAEPRVRYAVGSADVPHITKLKKTRSYTPGKATITEHNFKTPDAIPSGSTPSLVKLPGNDKSELFISTAIGGYGVGDASDAINNRTAEAASKLLIKACEAEYETSDGESSVPDLAPGFKFTPFDLTNPGAGFEEIVIKSITHTARTGSYDAGEDEPPEYSNTFASMPAKTPATPHQTVPKPLMHGLDIAIVVGPSGEEIFTDQFARAKIRFLRHRDAKNNDSDSCWVRCAQNWAGVSYGGLILPRVGMHVLVGYESGDMDRPIIVGFMPNPKQVQSYNLPTNKTRSTFRSQTYKGQGFNEWSMEDATGAERFFVHAQKDMATRVLNNRTARVDQHDVYSIGGNRTVEVTYNQKQEIGGSFNLTVGGTGDGALKALADVAGLAGQTAGLLQQAGGGGASLGSFATSIAGSALGFFSGGGLGSRQGVIAGSPPGNDAGEALAKAGDGMGQDAGKLFSLPGVMNTVVKAFKSDSVGVAHAEQIGMCKVVNVGQNHFNKAGKVFKVQAGEEFRVEVGGGTDKDNNATPPKAWLSMTKDGDIILYGINVYIIGENHVQIITDMLDHN